MIKLTISFVNARVFFIEAIVIIKKKRSRFCADGPRVKDQRSKRKSSSESMFVHAAESPPYQKQSLSRIIVIE